jgi:DNA polymerase III epsilon subunit-like protein
MSSKRSGPIVLCFDTETTGKPPPSSNPNFQYEGFFNDKNVKAEVWPRIVQLSFIVYDTGKLQQLDSYDQLIKMKSGVFIPPESTKVHGITDADALEKGIPIKTAMKSFAEYYNRSDFVVGHNVQFDINVVCAELTLLLRDPETTADEKSMFQRLLKSMLYEKTKKFCTMQNAKMVCALPKNVYDVNGVVKDITGQEVIDYTLDGKGQRKARNPSLENAHKILFKQKPNGQLHNALVDVAVCLRVFIKIFMDVDLCATNNVSKNKYICDLINPSDLKDEELPRRIGDAPIHPNIIKSMNKIEFKKYGTQRTASRSKSTKRSTRSLSVKKPSRRHTTSRRRGANSV